MLRKHLVIKRGLGQAVFDDVALAGPGADHETTHLAWREEEEEEEEEEDH